MRNVIHRVTPYVTRNPISAKSAADRPVSAMFCWYQSITARP